MGQIRSHRLPREPLRIVELRGGLATGLETLLIDGYAIRSYVWVDIDDDTHIIVSPHITHPRRQFPHLLSPEATLDWDTRLLLDVRTISLKLLRATFPEGIDLLLVNPPMQASHLLKTHRERTPMGRDVVRHILRLILYLSKAQPKGIGYL